MIRPCDLRTAALAVAVTLAAAARGWGQEDFPHPELEWKTITTDHFLVHYHEGAERTAATIARIAEDIYDPVTSFYDHRPSGKVSFVVKDYDDISNGAAYFYDNKIEIYAPSMDFELRGTHNWLRNVVTHEFTHIIQIQTSMKFGRQIPAMYFQWLGYESERRPDVLYGYPNIIVSYPISGFTVPAWFAEGVAQYNRKEFRYDFWDTHRDMLLRCYALDGNMLSWEQMGVFGKTSLGNESSYNAGFAFLTYLAERYGERAIVDISRNLGSLTVVTIDEAIERAVGKSGKDLYDEWVKSLQDVYAQRVAPIRTNLREGNPLQTDTAAKVIDPRQLQNIEYMLHPAATGPVSRATVGFANLYPVYSPDGKKVAYTSTKGGDYFSLSSLYVYDFTTRKERLVQAGVRTAPSWSPDGTVLYYARLTRENPHWSLQFDLYRYDLESEKETRITSGRRALNPSVSPDGTKIVFVVNRDGTTNLAIMNADGSDYRQLTRFSGGEQVYSPSWSPAGDQIVFDYSIKDGRDLAFIRADGSDMRMVVEGPDDSRSGRFSPDGKRLYFSSDRTGIFNIYALDLALGKVEQVTNVLGGAFYPTANGSGELLYSAYTSGGYKIYQLPSITVIAEGEHHYLPPTVVDPSPGSPVLASASPMPQFDWEGLRTYDDRNPPVTESSSYNGVFGSLSIFPLIRIDNYNPQRKGIELIKFGAYLASNDVLDKTGFFAGAAFNLKFERDLFLQFLYRGKVPLLYQLGLEPTASLEVYNVTRKTNADIVLPASTIPVEVEYDLLEFDIALHHQFVSQFSDVELRYTHAQYSAIIGSFVNPETNSLVPGSSDTYLIGNDISVTFDLEGIVPSRTESINPVGRRVMLRIGQEFNKFNGDGEYEITATGLQPVYKNYDFTRMELRWREYIPMFVRNHTMTLSLRGGTILGPTVDEFFDFYAGGLIGMRGYPFYAIGGNDMAVAGLEYRFPLVRNIDLRVAQLYFDKLYASVFTDFGNAWSTGTPALAEFKADVGVELRLETFSYYAYPTRFFFSAAYGLNQFDRYVESQKTTVTYGKEWFFHFGVLFDYDLF